MNVIVAAILAYLLLGLIVLGIFDLVTRRIRDRLQGKTVEAQLSMAQAGTPLSSGAARAMLMAAVWIFWPMVLIGAATDKKEKSSGS